MGTFQLNYLYFLSARGFTIAIQVIDQYLLDSYCSPGNYKDNSPFEKNHHETLALLSSNIKLNKTLYNNSIGQSLDRVYGMLLRKGGLTDEDCKYCADISTRDATQCCPNGKEYIVWYTNCMLRYSNRSIFSVMELETTTYLPTTSYRVNTVFNELINKFTNNLVPIVASNGTGASSSIKFAKGDVNYTGLNFQEIVQCTPYLSGSDCNRCLSSALNGRRYPNMFLTLSRGVLKPSCYARFENSITTVNGQLSPLLVRFWRPVLINIVSQQCSPHFLSLHERHNAKQVRKAHNAISSTSASKSGGLTDEDCKGCADISTRDATQYCPNGKEYIAWYNDCMLRYSNRSIFSVMELEPTIYLPTTSYRVNTGFNELINELTNNLVARASSNGTGNSSSIKFAKGDVNYTGLKFQGLVQCTPDLLGSDCNRCLSSALAGRRYPNMFLTLGRGVLKPSCYVRFENSITTDNWIDKPVFIVVPIVSLVAVILILVIIIYFCKRKWRIKEKFYG
ncbi:hypothetical protein C5167_019085, partial [Papaver somniferum]